MESATINFHASNYIRCSFQIQLLDAIYQAWKHSDHQSPASGETKNWTWKLTIGGWVCSEATSCLYLLMLRLGSMSSWRSLNNLWYLLGNFSQDSLNLETAPWPRPETIANIELKFLHSLHWPGFWKSERNQWSGAKKHRQTRHLTDVISIQTIQFDLDLRTLRKQN